MPTRHPLPILLAVTALAAVAAARSGLAQPAPLRGTVVNRSDHPLAEVRVELRSPDGGDPLDEQTTGDDGDFSIAMDKIRPGLELHLHKDGYQDLVLTIQPQHLVMADIRATMNRVRTAPSPTPKPTPAGPGAQGADPSWLSTTPEEHERAVRLFNEAVKQWEEAESETQKNDALRKIRQAASIDPNFPEPLQILSRLAIKRQNWAEASRYSEALIRIDPMDEEAIQNLYVSLIVMRHFKRVGMAAKRLISIEPEKIADVETHAHKFYTNNLFEMARALYQALTEVAPDDPNGFLNLGLCCSQLGDVECTRRAFGTFLAIAPEDNPDRAAVESELAALGEQETPE